MRYLLDTGILLRLPHRGDPLHSIIRQTLVSLGESGHTFVTGAQNMAEFWNVCTRPADARGGLALDIHVAHRRLRLLERFITVLPEPDSAYTIWKSLLAAHRIRGKQVHDARIAALMMSYRIRRILTLNAADFNRYTDIETIPLHNISKA